MTNSVVLSADYGYINQLETTIKSLIYHNHNLKIDVFNSDIPQEWFEKMNDYYHAIGITVKDIKVDPELLNKPVSRDHINTMTYARLLIPQMIDEDRVLYLDSDLVVNKNISELLQMDMQGYELAAVPDYVDDSTFNAGVLLLDNAKLKQHDNIAEQWLSEADNGTANDDQTILNNHYKDNYLQLDDTYNIGIGLEAGFYYHSDNPEALNNFLNRINNAHPFKIVHYETNDKPWNMTSSSQLRYLWWQYFALEPEEIVNHDPLPEFLPQSRGNVFTFTYDENVENIKKLVTALPDVTFHIAAYSYMGFKLIELLQYPNVRLYPNVIKPNLDNIMAKLDVYLDINYGGKDQNIINTIKQQQIPILSFNDVADQNSDYDHYEVFDDDDIDGMRQHINQLLKQN